MKKLKDMKLKNVLITGVVAIGIIGAWAGSDDEESADTENKVAATSTEHSSEKHEETKKAEPKKEEVKKPIKLTRKEKLLANIQKLMARDKAFDVGSYVQGDIPRGEYAFIQFDGSGQYYAETSTNGDIIANENFDNFGYAYVTGKGNVENAGFMVNVNSLDYLGVKSAKELFEIMNDEKHFKGSGYYKVGTDIPAGTYTFESVGSDGYVSVETGAVGNSEIINNENFNGRYSATVSNGQYLIVSNAEIK